MAVKHTAAGGIVVKTERGKTRVLLIKDSYGHWTWPKGHLEKGETPEQGALREIAEETGQTRTEIIKEIGRQEYYYELKGKTVFKTVHIFLIKASGREKIKVQTDEIEKAKTKYYAYLATGNFNEETAKIYSDFGFFTSDETLIKDTRKILQENKDLRQENQKQIKQLKDEAKDTVDEFRNRLRD